MLYHHSSTHVWCAWSAKHQISPLKFHFFKQLHLCTIDTSEYLSRWSLIFMYMLCLCMCVCVCVCARMPCVWTGRSWSLEGVGGRVDWLEWCFYLLQYITSLDLIFFQCKYLEPIWWEVQKNIHYYFIIKYDGKLMLNLYSSLQQTHIHTQASKVCHLAWQNTLPSTPLPQPRLRA